MGWQGLQKNKRFLRLGGVGYNFKDMGEKKSRLRQFILRYMDNMMWHTSHMKLNYVEQK